MAEIEKSVLIGHSASQMFALVDAVEDYPKFLPWCGGSSVTPQNDSTTHATIQIDYHHIKHSFTTRNIKHPPELITMTLLNEKLVGPVFFIIANNLVDAFIERAEEVYGSS